MTSVHAFACPLVLLTGTLAAADPPVDDWPTYRHDTGRSGVSSVQLSFPLREAWRVESQPPAPAWPQSPAKHDYAHRYYDLRPRQDFDRCYHVAVVRDRVYFGSSVEGTVTCLDHGEKGREVWTFFADGPVRFAPHVVDGWVYFGSDDGYAYCLDAADGSLRWRERAGPNDDMIWGNEHMVSVWPVRTSVMVAGDAVFWTAGLFPEEGMYLCRRRATDGKGGWTVTPELPSQGYLLATSQRLFVPTGKTQPRTYSRKDGTLLGQVGGKRLGGSWALISPDDRDFFYGPGVHGEMFQHGAAETTHIATIAIANRLVVRGDCVYFNTDAEIAKLRRSDRQVVWRKKRSCPYALIVAGRDLIAGGDGKVVVLDADGNERWSAKVEGKVYGLAVAGGSLFVSTDQGRIYGFRDGDRDGAE